MAVSNDFGALSKAFSGLGVDENYLISILGKWRPYLNSFKRGAHQFLIGEENGVSEWNDRHIAKLEREFLRFKNAMVLWAMHPWERDARLAKEALYMGPKSYGVLIEIACTRSSEELLGARKAYHSLFDQSIEEDVAFHADGVQRKLLVALVSSYRYEGERVNEETAKSEAKTLSNAIKNAGKKNPIENGEVVRILTTRSKLHLMSIYKHYKEISGKYIDEDLDADSSLKETVQCLCTPQTYFSKVLDAAFKDGEDHTEALTRVIVTRADVDMKEINKVFHKQYGVPVSKKIEERANGNFKDFLLTLVARTS